jgi:DNA-binding response OmpR family regulator
VKVLVVEDEEDIRDTLAEALASEGYEVVRACDGAEALEKLRACHPAVVLLDLMMPVMDGWAFRAAQREDPTVCRIPVIVVSAEGRAGGLDVAGFLQKPFDLDQLLTAVRHQVRAS